MADPTHPQPSAPPPAPPPAPPTIVKPAGNTDGLFRGRPYGPAKVFVVTFSGAAGESHAIWTSNNAHWELGLLRIKGTAAADYALADTKPESIIGMVDVDGVTYRVMNMAVATLRSNSSINARLLLVDVVGVASTVKGVCYGWEVTREGFYR
jgi:hypothetical protein